MIRVKEVIKIVDIGQVLYVKVSRRTGGLEILLSE